MARRWRNDIKASFERHQSDSDIGIAARSISAAHGIIVAWHANARGASL